MIFPSSDAISGQTDGDDTRPEARLNALLAGRSDITLASAESCTGGGVGARITSVAGSSDYFLGGITAYSNGAKAALLAVPQAVLDRVGAVSAECAAAMAEGARNAFGATIAVSTTGIAGPGGATARKPVGLVYLGLSTDRQTTTEEHRFPGDRAAVTLAAAERALTLLVGAVEQMIAPG